MFLHLYNTLKRKKEIFKPIKRGLVRMYTCGPTVYNYAHIGNLRSYIFSDVLKRVLILNGYKVKHIMNITDVGHLTSEATETGEDKLEAGATREGKTIWEIADFYTKAFLEDAEKLNILSADKYPRATEHIEEQIAVIKRLFSKGYAYDTPEVVYFDTAEWPKYGKFAHLNIKGLKMGARVKFDVKKRNATDFALWLKIVGEHKNHIMHWPSPWGEGFPGWHIECSAMSRKYLGQPFDIHTGGIDHIPIHHTNEIAQSEAAYGKPLAHFWMHGEFLVLGKPGREKRMGKSEGNWMTLRSFIEQGIDPMAFRYLCLTTHYRSKLYFNLEALKAAEHALINLREMVAALPEPNLKGDTKLEQKILKVVNNDLDTPRALAMLWQMVKSSEMDLAIVSYAARYLDQVLGLDLGRVATPQETPKEVEKLIDEREKARNEGNWARADKLRQRILELGYVVEDTKEGPKLKISI